MSDRIYLSRRQLEQIVGKDQNAIRSIEALFKLASETTPEQLNDVAFESADAATQITLLNARLTDLEDGSLSISPLLEMDAMNEISVDPIAEAY
jgi:hypothetical protein